MFATLQGKARQAGGLVGACQGWWLRLTVLHPCLTRHALPHAARHAQPRHFHPARQRSAQSEGALYQFSSVPIQSAAPALPVPGPLVGNEPLAARSGVIRPQLRQEAATQRGAAGPAVEPQHQGIILG